MTSTNTSSADGNIGLGVLALMTIALIAGEAHSRIDPAAATFSSPAPIGPQILIESRIRETGGAIGGAIRELRIIPAAIESRLDLDWAPDEHIIQEYQQAGF